MKSRDKAIAAPVLSAGIAILVCAVPARAADTLETFDRGASDAEVYVGITGLDSTLDGIGEFTELAMGFGISDHLSAWLVACISTDMAGGNPGAGFSTGIFGTVLDRDRFQLDLLLDVSLAGHLLEDLSIGPAFELNWDLFPDRGLWGLYLRAGVPISGCKLAPENHPGHVRQWTVFTLLGSYVMVRPGHQILLEIDVTFHIAPHLPDHPVEPGAVAIGYNVTLGPTVELVTEVALDIPAWGNGPSIAIMAGLILTLPVTQQ